MSYLPDPHDECMPPLLLQYDGGYNSRADAVAVLADLATERDVTPVGIVHAAYANHWGIVYLSRVVWFPHHADTTPGHGRGLGRDASRGDDVHGQR